MNLYQFLDSIKNTLTEDAAWMIENRERGAIRSWADDIYEAQERGGSLEVSGRYTKSGRPELHDVSEVDLG